MIRLLLASVAGVLAAFFAGVLVYVGVSYAYARRHVSRGAVGDVREAIREIVWALAVQPLLPLYYFIGHRMSRARRSETPATSTPIVFVHGYAQNRVSFLRIARELGRRGFVNLYGFNYPWWSHLSSNANRLARYVDRVCSDTGSEQVNLVCHSMGGLVAMEYISTKEGAKRVGRCVAIATPYAGVRWPGPILGGAALALRNGFSPAGAGAWNAPTKLLSLYSTHDNVVHPPSTSSLARFGGRDVEVGEMGHFAILYDPLVATAVADFLAETT